MSTDSSPAAQREHFISLLRRFHTAMLVTFGDEHEFHARPMAIAQVEDDGRLWFITAANTAKVHEIENDSHAHLTAQDGQSAFLAVSGRATVVVDRAKVDELWREPFRVWFPGGKDDPSIELISIRPVRGEFWDSTGVNGIKYLWEAAKAYATGTKPRVDDPDQHGVVRM